MVKCALCHISCVVAVRSGFTSLEQSTAYPSGTFAVLRCKYLLPESGSDILVLIVLLLSAPRTLGEKRKPIWHGSEVCLWPQPWSKK